MSEALGYDLPGRRLVLADRFKVLKVIIKGAGLQIGRVGVERLGVYETNVFGFRRGAMLPTESDVSLPSSGSEDEEEEEEGELAGPGSDTEGDGAMGVDDGCGGLACAWVAVITGVGGLLLGVLSTWLWFFLAGRRRKRDEEAG